MHDPIIPAAVPGVVEGSSVIVSGFRNGICAVHPGQTVQAVQAGFGLGDHGNRIRYPLPADRVVHVKTTGKTDVQLGQDRCSIRSRQVSDQV
jgi:hypothetical protein